MIELHEIEAGVERILVDKLDIAAPARDEDLFESGVLDSLSFVDLLYHIESEFGIKVSLADLEIENFQTVGRIAAFIAEHVTPASSSGGDVRAQVVKLG